MATRAQQARVGLFLVISVALIASGLVLIKGWSHEENVPYWVEFQDSVLGLKEGAVVEYLGVPVGTVEGIRVNQCGHAHVDILVSPSKVILREGVEAKTVLFSLATGVLYISLAGGDLDAPGLPPNSQIPTKPSLVAAVSSRAEEILDDLSEIAGMVRQGLSGIEEGDLNNILDHFDFLLTDARKFLDNGNSALEDIQGELSASLGEFRNLTEDLEGLSGTVDETVKTIKQKVEQLDVEQTGERLSDVLDNVSQLAEQLGKSIETLDTVTRSALHEVDNVEYGLRETLRSATETLESIRSLTDSIEEDPAMIIRGKGKPTGD